MNASLNKLRHDYVMGGYESTARTARRRTPTLILLLPSFFNLFLIVVASYAFAISITSRKETFVAPRCPFPTNLTRICHKFVLQIFIFALSCLISYSRFLISCIFTFLSNQSKKLLQFFKNANTCSTVLLTCLNHTVWF